MKRGWKIFWIVCGVCVGIGLVCCMVSLIMGVSVEAINARFPHGIHLSKNFGIFWSDDDDDDYDDVNVPVMAGNDSKTYTGVSSIDMDVWAGQVEIRRVSAAKQHHHEIHNHHEITVMTENIDKRIKLRYYMDGDELKIKTKKKVIHVDNPGIIYIYVPEQYRFDEVSLNVSAGSLYVEDILAQELSVDVGAGEAVIDSFTAEETDLNCGAGEITAFGNVEREADIDCGIGEITFTTSGRESDYNYSISCGIGEVQCGNSTYSGIGHEREIDNNAGKEMNIDCGIGQVNVSFGDEL